MNHKVFLFLAVTLLVFLTVFSNSFAQSPCKLKNQAHATLVHTGKTVCALESTIRSWERQGFAISTSKITVPTQATLVEEDVSIPLEKCDRNHVRVSLTNVESSTFCVTESIAQRWIQEGTALEISR